MAPYHALIHKRLGLVTMALGRAYLAFCQHEERRLTMQLLETSTHPDSEIMNSPGMVEHLIKQTQKLDFAERNGNITADASSSVAVPIYEYGKGKILATIGMTYYTKAVRRDDVLERYVPQLKAASTAISESVARMAAALEAEKAACAIGTTTPKPKVALPQPVAI